MLLMTLIVGGLLSALVIRLASSKLTQNSSDITDIDTNLQYKNEITSFVAKQITGQDVKISNRHRDLKPLVPEVERDSLLEYAGVDSAMGLPFDELKRRIPVDHWNHDYLLKKVRETLDLLSLRNDPIAEIKFIRSMMQISEIKDDVAKMLHESLKEYSIRYNEHKSDYDSEYLPQFYQQLIMGYLFLGERSPESAIAGAKSDERVEDGSEVDSGRSVASLSTPETSDPIEPTHESHELGEHDSDQDRQFLESEAGN